MIHRQTKSQTDEQTDRQVNGKTDRYSGRLTVRQTDKKRYTDGLSHQQIDRQTQKMDICIYRQLDSHTDMWLDRQMHKQTNGNIDRQTNGKMHRQTNGWTYRQMNRLTDE